MRSRASKVSFSLGINKTCANNIDASYISPYFRENGWRIQKKNIQQTLAFLCRKFGIAGNISIFTRHLTQVSTQNIRDILSHVQIISRQIIKLIKRRDTGGKLSARQMLYRHFKPLLNMSFLNEFIVLRHRRRPLIKRESAKHRKGAAHSQADKFKCSLLVADCPQQPREHATFGGQHRQNKKKRESTKQPPKRDGRLMRKFAPKCFHMEKAV